MIFVTSDLHLNHPGILEFSRQNFKTVEEHDEYVIKIFNRDVGKDDLVYILGDVGFKPKDILAQKVKRLNGRKVLIRGNHDKLTNGEYRAMGFIDVIDHPVYFSDHLIGSHEPRKEAYKNPYVKNAHGHLHRSAMSDSHFYNVNIELHDRVIPLPELIEWADKTSKPTIEYFGGEWYKDFYKDSEVKKAFKG